MPRDLPKFVERNTVKGRTYYSFRRGKGERIRLPDFGTPEFDEAYAAALLGEVQRRRAAPRGHEPGTVGAAIVSYFGMPKFLRTRATTKVSMRRRLELLRKAHGHRTLSGLTPVRVEKMLAPFADRPGEYVNLLKLLRIVVKHARRLGWLKHDPTVGVDRPKGGSIRSWTDDEIAQFEKRWPIGTRERTAFALQLHTGQRRSDVHRMTWADISPAGIAVRQQKTQAKLVIALHPALRATLDQARREHVAILTTDSGQAFTVAGYSNWLRDAIRAAGLPLECRPHGLRKAAGRRLAEAGCSAPEIMAVLGHKTLAEAERYTRDADQVRLAKAAVNRLAAQDANEISPTNLAKFGEIPKTEGNSGG
jgi:integrase